MNLVILSFGGPESMVWLERFLVHLLIFKGITLKFSNTSGHQDSAT